MTPLGDGPWAPAVKVGRWLGASRAYVREVERVRKDSSPPGDPCQRRLPGDLLLQKDPDRRGDNPDWLLLTNARHDVLACRDSPCNTPRDCDLTPGRYYRVVGRVVQQPQGFTHEGEPLLLLDAATEVSP